MDRTDMAESGRARLTVGLTIIVTVIAFEALAVATVAPQVARELGGLDLYGWTFSAFMLAGLVGTVVAGHAADRHGPAPPYLAGVVLFTGGLVVCGAAPTMPVFVVGRAVQGLGAGALASIAFVTVGLAFSESERPRQFAILSTAWVVPGLIAPAVGGLVAEQLGWRWVFLGIAALPGATIAPVLPQPRRLGVTPGTTRAGTLPVRAALLLAAGTGAVVEGLGSTDALVVAPCVAIGLVVAVPALRQLVPRGTLRAARGVPAAIATRGLATFSFFGTDAFLAFALAEQRGLSAVEVGLVLTPTTITWSIGAWIQARTTERFTRRTMASAGLTLVVAGAVLTGVAVLIADLPAWIAAATWAVGGLGMGLSYSPTNLVVLTDAPPGTEGSATASVQLTDGLGTALGTGIGGAILAAGASAGWTRTGTLAAVFAVMTAAGAVGVIAARRFPRDPAPVEVGPVPVARGAMQGSPLASAGHDDDLS